MIMILIHVDLIVYGIREMQEEIINVPCLVQLQNGMEEKIVVKNVNLKVVKRE
jgi:hypothetical protein